MNVTVTKRTASRLERLAREAGMPPREYARRALWLVTLGGYQRSLPTLDYARTTAKERAKSGLT